MRMKMKYEETTRKENKHIKKTRQTKTNKRTKQNKQEKKHQHGSADGGADGENPTQNNTSGGEGAHRMYFRLGEKTHTEISSQCRRNNPQGSMAQVNTFPRARKEGQGRSSVNPGA